MENPIPKSFGLSLFDRLFSFIDLLRPLDKWLFIIALCVFVISSTISIYQFSESKLINVPVRGGTLIEGVVGSPRFINPVLAITKADNDLTALTYSGLLRLSPDGTLENDLADTVTISDDGLVYNIMLKQNKYFHDGTKITADDVAFTIGLIQKTSLKSPLYGNWSGVTVEVIDTYELNLVLDNPYAPFKENLTVGILPKHIWSTLSEEELPFSQHNIEPIGSGPYAVKKVVRNQAGLISEYTLKPANDYQNSTNISSIVFRFYPNEEAVLDALQKGEITSTAYLGEKLLPSVDKNKFKFEEEPLPRIFSIFFNQNKNPALRDKAARTALEILIDRQELINQSVNGYGRPTEEPIPLNWQNPDNNHEQLSKEDRLAKARQVLEDGGWSQSTNGRWVKSINDVDTPLIFSIRSSNDVVFEKIAEYLSQSWQELGIEATFEFYEQSDLVQTIIRPRDYQALLFGIDLGRSLDLYPFWHSASREDPGLNVSLYANMSVDELVSDIRTATSSDQLHELLDKVADEIDDEKPAIFLFSPTFEYVTKPSVITGNMSYIQKASERFSNITSWHMNESGVWPFLKGLTN